MQSSFLTIAAPAFFAFRTRQWGDGPGKLNKPAPVSPARPPEPPVTYEQFLAGTPICWAGCVIIYQPVYGQPARITQK